MHVLYRLYAYPYIISKHFYLCCCVYHIRICLLDSKGYYAILGVSERAKYTEIRAAYRLLAKKYHPDRNNSDFAEDIIKKINAAFEVLSQKKGI